MFEIDKNRLFEIRKELERVYYAEEHEVKLGLTSSGSFVFIESFCNTSRYLMEPNEVNEINWDVLFYIDKEVWESLEDEIRNLIQSFSAKVVKYYRGFEYDFPGSTQLLLENSGAEFMSNRFEELLQENNVNYIKLLSNLI